MRKIKNHLWKSILFLGLLILTTNCADDDQPLKVLEQKSGIIIKQLNYQELLSDNKVIEKIQDIQKLQKKSLYNKSTKYIAEYDFSIDLETAKTVELENYKTYNFLIQRENPQDDKLENLFLRLNNVGEYDTYILKYDFSATEFENLTIVDLNNRRTEYTPIDIAFSPTTNTSEKYICTETWDTIEFISPRDFGSDENNIIVTFLVSSECVWFNEGAGIPIGENNYENDPTDTSSGGAPTDTTNNNYVYSTPVFKSPEAKMLDDFFENLTDGQNDCLNSQSNLDLHSEIKTFLKANFDENNTTLDENFIDAQNFAKLVLDNCGSQVDWAEKIILDPSFKNNIKALCAYEKLKEAGGLKQILKDFFNTKSTANLIIKLEPNLTCNNNPSFGCTSFNKTTQTATISVDTDYITEFQWQNSPVVYKTPMLSIAKIIIHEAIHAQLFYNAYQVDINTELSDKTFEDLYEEYRKLEGWQHEYMADHYISIISSALEEVHLLLNDQGYINYINNNYPDWTWQQIYENMAWNGLTQTTAGQTYLSNPDNATLYSLQNTNVATNSNETQNCD
ncbi:hypothetical protein R3X25_07375 [Lutibacter sp. TH_r2]|uniref:hypothetical protein n=1 Tax=Lutibacter sp. TH_r2 TaxID=3082083 RepID=UPI0029548839|nr:hypothetical protein [Lutibacter sp. TH_r2]MDV7187098.1 hypothetical protein [Lutibacter sp. TH_r2]